MRKLIVAALALSGTLFGMIGEAWVAGEALLLRPHGFYPYYAFVGSFATPNGVFFPLPQGRQVGLCADYGWGYKVEVGYRLCRNELRLNWTSYNHGSRGAVQAPADQVVSPVLSHPVTPDFAAFPGGTARVNQGIEYDVLDGDLARMFGKECSRLTGRGFVGVRYARIVGQQDVRFFDNTGEFEIKMVQRSDVQGTGPRIGMAAHVDLCWGLGLKGELAGHLLIGSAKSSYTDLDINEPAQFATLRSDAVCRLLPSSEIRFGIDFKRCILCGISLLGEVGYQLSYYCGAGQSVSFYEGVGFVSTPTAANRVTSQPISFDGWYFRLGAEY